MKNQNFSARLDGAGAFIDEVRLALQNDDWHIVSKSLVLEELKEIRDLLFDLEVEYECAH